MAVSKEFADEIAYALGIDNSDGFVTRFLTEWAKWEGSKATFNPLATTQSGYDSTDFNSTGVKNYKTLEDGIAATLRTLKNGRYDGIIAAMKNKDLSNLEALLPEFTTWGTGHAAGFVKEIKDGTFATAVGGAGEIPPTVDKPPTGPDDDPYGIREAGTSAGEGAQTMLDVLDSLKFGSDKVQDILSQFPEGAGDSLTSIIAQPGFGDALGELRPDKRDAEKQARLDAASDSVEDFLLRGETPPDDLLAILNYQLGIIPASGGDKQDKYDLVQQLMDISATAVNMGAMSQKAAQSKLDNQISLAGFADRGPYTPGHGPGSTLSRAGLRSADFKGTPITFDNPGRAEDVYNETLQQMLDILGASDISGELSPQPVAPTAAAVPQATPYGQNPNPQPQPTPEQVQPFAGGGIDRVPPGVMSQGSGGPMDQWSQFQRQAGNVTQGSNNILQKTMEMLQQGSQAPQVGGTPIPIMDILKQIFGGG